MRQEDDREAPSITGIDTPSLYSIGHPTIMAQQDSQANDSSASLIAAKATASHVDGPLNDFELSVNARSGLEPFDRVAVTQVLPKGLREVSTRVIRSIIRDKFLVKLEPDQIGLTVFGVWNAFRCRCEVYARSSVRQVQRISAGLRCTIYSNPTRLTEIVSTRRMPGLPPVLGIDRRF